MQLREREVRRGSKFSCFENLLDLLLGFSNAAAAAAFVYLIKLLSFILDSAVRLRWLNYNNLLPNVVRACHRAQRPIIMPT